MDRHKTQMPGVLPYEEREDERLMARYAAGDEKAFRELYQRYRARAYGYLSKRLSNTSTVDEIFQQVFLKLHRSRAQYDEGRLFPAWFFTICRTAVVDHFRRKGKEGLQVPLDEESISESPEPIANAQELPEGIMLQLSEKQREAVRLRYEEELAFSEIAARLNTTQENVRQLISRGIRRLKGLVGARK